MRLPLLLSLATLVACSGETDLPVGEPQPRSPDGAAPPPGADGFGPDGAPPEGAPPQGAGPEGAGPAAEPGGPCTPTAFSQERYPDLTGAGVTVTGEITYQGLTEGDLLIDVLTVPGDIPASAVYHLVCGAPGPLEATLPRDLGEVMLVAYLDTDRDGPDDDDPAGLIAAGPITVADDDIEGVAITISEAPELGDYERSAIVVATSAEEGDEEPPPDQAPPDQPADQQPGEGLPALLPSGEGEAPPAAEGQE
jgi:hypothetical protein